MPAALRSDPRAPGAATPAPTTSRRRWLGLGGVLAGALVLASGARAQQPPAVPFQMLVVPTFSEPGLDRWYRVPPTAAPHLPSAARLHPDQPVQLVLVLSGLGDRGDGTARVTWSLALSRDGAAPQTMADELLAFEGPPPPLGIGVAAQQIPSLAFDADEPLGPFELEIVAHDQGSDARVTQRVSLELVAWSGRGDELSAELGDWRKAYHLDPRPAEALNAWLAEPSLVDADSGQPEWGVLGFYRALFRDEAWLLPHALEVARESDDGAVRERVRALMALLGDRAGLTALGPPRDAAPSDEVLLERFDLGDPYAEPLEGSTLDVLWGEFLASGRLAPVRRLAEALAWAGDEDAVQAFASSHRTAADLAAAQRGATFLAARWSLLSNARQHKLVAHYLLGILATEELAELERLWLTALIEKAYPDGVPSGL